MDTKFSEDFLPSVKSGGFVNIWREETENQGGGGWKKQTASDEGQAGVKKMIALLTWSLNLP